MAAGAKTFAFSSYRLVPERRSLVGDGREVPVRGRAFDLLLALVEGRDRILSKDELLARVWPSRVVEEGNLTVHIASLRKLLGSGIIATISGRGYRFVAPVTELRAEDAHHAPPAERIHASTAVRAWEPADALPWPGDLPRPLTKLIGRDGDVDAVEARLREARLVTVVGAGGVGKTRLAMAVADRALSCQPNGAWLADLGPLEDPRLVLPSIASALGVDVGGGDALRVVTAWLADRRGLLLLDGCEHLLRAAADAAEAILRNCPGIAILATSREPLRADGERLHRLLPLATAAPDTLVTAAQLAEFPASALFVERTRAALGEFAPGDTDAVEVMRICQRLDGIPLAIELAAPALQAMTLPELRMRLERHFGLLTAGRRTALARQQTLRAAIGWSIDLLEPAERALLLRLAVFGGGWTSESATFVMGGAATEDEVCRLIAALVDKSLVQADLTGVQARYRLLVPTRFYAAERLSAHDLAEGRRNLVRWLARAYERAEVDWPFMADDEWFSLYAPEIENLRTGLAWAFGADGDERLGVELVSLTEHVWGELSLTGELHAWFDLAISRIDEATPPEVAGRLWLGRCGWVAPRGPTALDAAQRAVALFRKAGARLDLARALWRQAWQHVLAGNVAAAEVLFDEAEDLLRRGRASKALVSCLRARAASRMRGDEPDAARANLQEALAIATDIRSPRDVALTLGSMAELHCAEGRIAVAISVAQEALACLGPSQARSAWVQHIAGSIASYRLAEGNVEAARPIIVERLTAARLMGLAHEILANIERLALIAALEGRHESAARLLGYVEAALTQSSVVRSFGSKTVHDRLVTVLRGSSRPQAELDRLAARGAALDEDAIMAEAMAVALRP
jgi:predicted ATPase/DNA-binding winged helix-turn-helix (wHTH) protein